MGHYLTLTQEIFHNLPVKNVMIQLFQPLQPWICDKSLPSTITTSSLAIKQSWEGLWCPRSPSNALKKWCLPCTRECGAWRSRGRQWGPGAGSSSEQRNFPDWYTGLRLVGNISGSLVTYLENHVRRPIAVVVETTLELKSYINFICKLKYSFRSLFGVHYSQVIQEMDINC